MRAGNFLGRLAALILLTCLSTACSLLSPTSQMLPSTPAWVYADLRAIDPPDAITPETDLIAAYVRRAKRPGQASWPSNAAFEWQIRLELMEVSTRGGADLYLALDHAPGGARWLPTGTEAALDWDTLVLIPDAGPAQAWDASHTPLPGLGVHNLRDSEWDSIEIGLPGLGGRATRAGLGVQVISTTPGSQGEADRMAPISSSGEPPPRVKVWLAFWNSLPAYTPAQAVRRWDGAHTGPYGGRHGLYNLLRTARGRGIPLALLDIKALPSLAALDYSEGLPLVQRMVGEGLLLLPDVQPVIGGYPEGQALRQASAETSLQFGLPAGEAVFLSKPVNQATEEGPVTSLPGLDSYRDVIVAWASNPGDLPQEQSGAMLSVYRHASQRIYAISGSFAYPEAAPSGPSPDVMRSLATAGSRESGEITVLGGDLSLSGWGDPASARQSFAYLSKRPWVRFISAHELFLLPAAALPLQARPAENRLPGETRLLQPAVQTPADPGNALIHFLSTLYGPLSQPAPELEALRTGYAGQAGVLNFVSAWASQPFPVQSCEQDLDLDGHMECVLASESSLAVFDTRLGGLNYLFGIQDGSLHQLIAPSALLGVGLGEASEWAPGGGLTADPRVIPGAFSVPDCNCPPTMETGTFVFRSGEMERSYSLPPGGKPGSILIQVRSPIRSLWQIPLVVDPWQRFAPGWGERFLGELTESGGVWGWQDGAAALIRSNALLAAVSFVDSRDRVGITEDPNFEYPPGHYLPFPLTVVQISGEGELWVEIGLQTPPPP